MQCSIFTSGNMVTAKLSGELDHHSAKSIREQIDCEVEAVQPDKLFLDFKDITFMDSSGIGLVMGRYRLMQLHGGEVIILNPSPSIRKVMRLAGLGRLAKIETSA